MVLSVLALAMMVQTLDLLPSWARIYSGAKEQTIRILQRFEKRLPPSKTGRSAEHLGLVYPDWRARRLPEAEVYRKRLKVS